MRLELKMRFRMIKQNMNLRSHIFLTLTIMDEKLLDKVSIEKIDELFSSLSEVIKSMRSVQENSEECFQDETHFGHVTL